jgi:hypothetical protein
MVDSVLSITGLNIPPYSNRGANQTLEPIEQSKQTRRTINGVLRDLAMVEFQKFRSVISCEDQRPLAFNNIWPGKELIVDCIAELSYLTAGGSAARPVVPGSSYVEGDYTFYRPRLTMRLTEWTNAFDEYEASAPWSITLEEI